MVIKRSWSFQKQLSPHNRLCFYHSHPCHWSTHPSGKELMDIFTYPACHSKGFSFYFWLVRSQKASKSKILQNQIPKRGLLLLPHHCHRKWEGEGHSGSSHSQQWCYHQERVMALWPGQTSEVGLWSHVRANPIKACYPPFTWVVHASDCHRRWYLHSRFLANGSVFCPCLVLGRCSAIWSWVSDSAQDLSIQAWPTLWHLSIQNYVDETLVSLHFCSTHSSALKTNH